MGIAAYNRGSQAISDGIRADHEAAHPAEFEMMDMLNAMPKYPEATPPWGDVHLGPGNGGWWIYCAKNGFGYWYVSLYEAVKRWDVSVVGYSDGIWDAVPNLSKS